MNQVTNKTMKELTGYNENKIGVKDQILTIIGVDLTYAGMIVLL
ncbi:MAG: hypothetical protein M2R45_05077 [Verrucomicrobia subdivision 3 bacterium]|nr:hypothetical protein [Limisphaerales bacterium]MCS1417154.1 hypothetical protein [Limisphaerales bacterium]